MEGHVVVVVAVMVLGIENGKMMIGIKFEDKAMTWLLLIYGKDVRRVLDICESE